MMGDRRVPFAPMGIDKTHINLRPYDIGFTQDSIANTMRVKVSGKTKPVKLGDIVDLVIDGDLDIRRIPKISVFHLDQADACFRWFSWDNRRLWVFQKLQDYYDMTCLNSLYTITCRKVSLCRVNFGRISTIDEGQTIQVRGPPGGSGRWDPMLGMCDLNISDPCMAWADGWQWYNDCLACPDYPCEGLY